MVLVREVLLSSGLTGPPPQRAIFLLVQLTSAPVLSDNVLVGVSHPSQPGCDAPMNDFDQTTELYVGGIRLSSSAPTSTLSGYQSSKFWVFTSSATLLVLPQCFVCCNDQLNSRSLPVIRFIKKITPSMAAAPPVAEDR